MGKCNGSFNTSHACKPIKGTQQPNYRLILISSSTVKFFTSLIVNNNPWAPLLFNCRAHILSRCSLGTRITFSRACTRVCASDNETPNRGGHYALSLIRFLPSSKKIKYSYCFHWKLLNLVTLLVVVGRKSNLKRPFVCFRWGSHWYLPPTVSPRTTVNWQRGCR